MLDEQRSGLVEKLCRKLRSAIYKVRVERFYVLDGPPSPVAYALAHEIRCLTQFSPELGRELTRVKGFKINWKKRFDLAHRCYLSVCDGKAIGYGWVCFGSWFVDLEKPLGFLQKDVAYIYDEITMDGYRGKRLAPARLAYMAADMKGQGYPRSCQLIADDNYPSQRSALTAGYQATSSVVRLHRFALRLRVHQGSPPRKFRLGFSLPTSATRVPIESMATSFKR